MRWVKNHTFEHVMEQLHYTFKTMIIPARSIKLMISTNDPKRLWPEHNLIKFAVSEACGDAESLV